MATETDELALEGFLPYRLNRAAAAVSARMAHVYGQEFELTVPGWRVLALLGERRRAAGLTATTIGRLSAMHKAKVSRAVGTLSARRWVERQVDPKDRRVEHLRLTAEGRRAYAELVPRMRAAERRLLDAVGSDLRALDRGLTALERALGLDDGDRCS